MTHLKQVRLGDVKLYSKKTKNLNLNHFMGQSRALEVHGNKKTIFLKIVCC